MARLGKRKDVEAGRVGRQNTRTRKEKGNEKKRTNRERIREDLEQDKHQLMN